VSSRPQHKKPSSFTIRSSGAHRKVTRAKRAKRATIAAAIACAALGAGISQVVTHGSWLPAQTAALNRAAGAGPRSAGTAEASAHPAASPRRPGSRRSSPAPTPTSTPVPTPTPAATAVAGYANPLRSVGGLIPERIDMGVDFGGSGPVYALGDGVITSATADSAGWPGGGWITYRLTSGPAEGLSVYVAEDVTPDVQVGQLVTSATVIATMFNGGDGIETGWAQASGGSAESQLPAAGGISGAGPFPTDVGLNFETLLQSLGVPAANNRGDAPYGLLPAGYPAAWS
jgi:murein DD-endopeptidase MepM/ murein hydrolase activator NlpD